MKERLTRLFHNTISISKHLYGQKALIISSVVILLACLFFLLFERSTYRSDTVTKSTRLSPTASSTSTKWWIKVTPTLSTEFSNTLMTPKSAETSLGICSPDMSSKIKRGGYAHISLSPLLPNRLRSGAGKAYPYIGHIEPGAGVKVMDGPLCADGFSWWLVESNDTYLKGWTATTNGSEQWIIPCADPNIPCRKVQINIATSIVTTQDNDSNRCKSYMFDIGMFAQVNQSELLVIRSEPYTGAVIGYAGPSSKVRIVDGPSCAGKTIWWKVNNSNNNLAGWATEANLTSCSKEECP